MRALIRNIEKPIKKNYLRNCLDTYETEYEFLKADIESYRDQDINNKCFSVLHPWVYDLDTVDF